MPVTTLIRTSEHEYNGDLARDTIADVRLEAYEHCLAHGLPSSAQPKTFLNPLVMRSAYP